MKVSPNGHVMLEANDVAITSQLAALILAHRPVSPSEAADLGVQVLVESARAVREHNDTERVRDRNQP